MRSHSLLLSAFSLSNRCPSQKSATEFCSFPCVAAVAVGYSAALLHRSTHLLHVDSEKKDETSIAEQLSRALSHANTPSKPRHNEGRPSINLSPFQQKKEAEEEAEGTPYSDSQASYALVIDGLALPELLENGGEREVKQKTRDLLALAERCESVICCRISPQLKVKMRNSFHVF